MSNKNLDEKNLQAQIVPKEKDLDMRVQDIIFSMDAMEFACLCAKYLQRPSTTVQQDLKDSLEAFFLTAKCNLQNITIKNGNGKFLSATPSADKVISLRELKDNNVDVNNYVLKITTSSAYQEKLSYRLVLPDFLCTEAWCWEAGPNWYLPWRIYGEKRTRGEVEYTTNYKITETPDAVFITSKPFRKKYTRINIKIEMLGIRSTFLKMLFDMLKEDDTDNYNIGHDAWPVIFVHKITGDICFCECFRDTVSKYGNRVLSVPRAFYPPYLKEALTNVKYKNGICHLCRGIPSPHMYGYISQVGLEKYGERFCFPTEETSNIPLSKEKLAAHKERRRDAENIVRQKMGLRLIGEKWQHETMLYKLVASLFPSYKIFREASPEWLWPQRFDIYVPDIHLAVEYQGEQHYQEVSLFGGAEGLKNTQNRDKMKKDKCAEHGVDLIYFSYKEEISEARVRTRLHKYSDYMGSKQ